MSIVTSFLIGVKQGWRREMATIEDNPGTIPENISVIGLLRRIEKQNEDLRLEVARLRKQVEEVPSKKFLIAAFQCRANNFWPTVSSIEATSKGYVE